MTTFESNLSRTWPDLNIKEILPVTGNRGRSESNARAPLKAIFNAGSPEIEFFIILIG